MMFLFIFFYLTFYIFGSRMKSSCISQGRRTVDDICQMIEAVNKFNLQNSFAKIMTSVEIEKARPEMG